MSDMRLSPYINFQGKAREMMEFYQQALGGTLDLLAMDETGASHPAGPDERIAQARLDTGGALILGSDGHPNFPPTVGDHMAIALTGTDKERITQALTALAEGGKLKSPLRPQPWGGETGYVEDKFGMNWIVSVEPA